MSELVLLESAVTYRVGLFRRKTVTLARVRKVCTIDFENLNLHDFRYPRKAIKQYAHLVSRVTDLPMKVVWRMTGSDWNRILEKAGALNKQEATL